MKKINFLLLLAILSCMGLHAEVYNLPSGDGDKGEKTVTGSLQFYDAGGENGNASTYCGTKVSFSPTTEGQQLAINFSMLDIDPEKATIYLYDGDCTYTSWNKIPEGYMAVITNENAGETFQTTNAEGKLSLFYLHASYGGNAHAGWEATVSEFTPAPMSFVGAEASQEGLESSYPANDKTVLLQLVVETESSLNPLELSEVAFDLAGTTSLDDIASLSLFRTNAAIFSSNDTVQTLTSFEQAGSFTATEALNPGKNYFWIACSVKPEAVAGNTLDVACNQIHVGEETKSVTNGAPTGEVAIDNVALLSETHTTYSVGDVPITLYDDGGKEGDISAQFEGSATFVPATAGMKVKVEFVSLDLFNTSSTGMNDILKVYHGSQILEENLATTLLKDIKTVSSTAADGAISISLKSTTGIPKGGFVAVVSAFTPQPMVLAESVVSRPDTATISSGSMNEQMLCINLKTTNTEPALKLEGLNLSAACFAQVAGVNLYYTGESATFNEEGLLGSTTPSAVTYTLALEEAITLKEGDNYLWVTYDMKEGLTNGALIDGAVSSVTLNGASVAVASDGLNEGRTLFNQYVSVVGERDIAVAGEWKYISEDSGYGKYVAVEGDQVVTFKPSSAGHVVEVDYDLFEVAFSTSSYYGVTATYEIYSGSNREGALLWSSDSSDKAAKGPEGAIRSNAPDGALTFLFNANDASSYYARKGWSATVREYKSKPMAIDSVVAFQENDNILKPADKAAEMIGFKVVASGDLTPIALNSITVNLKESAPWVDSVAIYSTHKEATFGTLHLVGRVAATENSVVVPCAEYGLLSEGDNFFWVAYDLASSLESEQVIDAALSTITLEEGEATITNGDPEGERITKNIISMGVATEQVVTVENSMVFFDNGGGDNVYEKESGTMTFLPATDGLVIKAVIRKFKTYSGDDLNIYDGTDTEATKLKELYGIKDDSDLPITLLGSSESGALTFEFDVASYGGVNDGWEIEISQYAPQPLSQGTIEATALEGNLLRGANVLAYRVDYNVVGDLGSFAMNDLSLTLSDNMDVNTLSSIELFATDTISTFTAIHPIVGAINGREVTFHLNDTVTRPGCYKYWVRLNIATTAAVDSPVSATLCGTPFSGSVASAFRGTYTIGASESADYTTFADAVAALANGVDGAVVFNIEAGTYNESLFIGEVIGASATNTVTFQAASGERDVVINYTSTDELKDFGAITVAGADYITLQDIQVESSNGYSPGVLVRSCSEHVTLSNMEVSIPYSTSYSGYPYGIYVMGENTAYRNCDFFTLENSVIKGGRIGVNVAGTGYTSLPKQRGARILNCQVEGQGAMGIYMQLEMDSEISGNLVTNNVATTSNFKAIDVVAMPNGVVKNNRINLATENYATGIYLRQWSFDWSNAEATRIYNNEIVLGEMSGSSASYGINASDPLRNTEIAYNSILLNASETKANSVAIFINTTSTKPCVASTIAHNLLQNRAGGLTIRVNSESSIADGNLAFAHNNYYTNGTTLGNIGGEEVVNFADWTLLTSEVGSSSVEAMFLSENLLDLESNEGLIEAPTAAYASTDILGRSRGENSYGGAYTYSVIVEDAPLLLEGYPAVNNIAHNQAILALKADVPTWVRYVVQASELDAPSLETVLACEATEMAANMEQTWVMEGLAPTTSYRVYVVLTTLRGTSSEVIASEVFTTTYLPTAVATFEAVRPTELADFDFEDGTAAFHGFTIVEEENNKVAMAAASGAKIAITNTTNNLLLDGFYLQSNATVTLVCSNVAEELYTKEVAATREWSYINLRDVGAIHHVEFRFAEGSEVRIDNFCGTPQPLEVILEDGSINEGEAARLEYLVAGGVAPYRYAWLNAMGDTLSTEADYAITATSTDFYTLLVTDSWENQVAAKATISVTGTQHVADFENLRLDAESYKPDYAPEDKDMTHFFSGSFQFNTYVSDNYWEGIGYSNETSTEYANFLDQFRSSVGHGVDDSENYAIVYRGFMTEASLQLTHQAAGDTVAGFYMTNTAWIVDAILNGDGVTPDDAGFVQNDSLVVTVIGLLDGVATENGRLSIPLADFRNADANEHYYLDSWQWFDLSSLGKVDELKFEFSGSKNGSWGLNTPCYFAMDNVGASRPETLLEEQLLADDLSLDVASLSGFDTTAGAIHFSLMEHSENISVATLEGTTLRVAMDSAEAEVVLLAMQGGKKEYLRIPLKQPQTTGLNEATILSKVWSENGTLFVACNANNYRIELFTPSGVAIRRVDNLNGSTSLEVGISNKMLLVRISSEAGSSTHRVMMQ